MKTQLEVKIVKRKYSLQKYLERMTRADRIRTIRALCEAMGIKDHMLRKYRYVEEGCAKATMNTDQARSCANVLNISLNELLTPYEEEVI